MDHVSRPGRLDGCKLKPGREPLKVALVENSRTVLGTINNIPDAFARDRRQRDKGVVFRSGGCYQPSCVDKYPLLPVRPPPFSQAYSPPVPWFSRRLMTSYQKPPAECTHPEFKPVPPTRYQTWGRCEPKTGAPIDPPNQPSYTFTATGQRVINGVSNIATNRGRIVNDRYLDKAYADDATRACYSVRCERDPVRPVFIFSLLVSHTNSITVTTLLQYQLLLPRLKRHPRFFVTTDCSITDSRCRRMLPNAASLQTN